MEKKKAIITGITGQDGSYLSDLLLSKNYKVVGVSRRTSTNNTERIKHNLDNPDFEIVEGDITDSSSITGILKQHNDVSEFYNLAAQSHVGTSFKQPGATWDITGKGCINILQSIVDLDMQGQVRFYQASSSEMFGKNYDEDGVIKYQDEETSFLPQSPYAIAKCAAHYATRLYREAYGLHASAGILFNHECLSYYMPITYMNSHTGEVGIDCISDFFVKYVPGNKGKVPDGLKIWDKNGWTKIKYASSFRHDFKNNNKGMRIVNSRNSVYAVTDDHVCIMEDRECPSKDISLGDRVKLTPYPKLEVRHNLEADFCKMIGLLVADGHIKNKHGQFTNTDPDIRSEFNRLWTKYGGECQYYPSTSGFTGEIVGRLELKNISEVLGDYGADLYTFAKDVFGHRYKKIPNKILNSSVDCMESFLIGYNMGDGLKSNPCVYRFKNFKTNSPVLASGLLFLVSKVTGQKYNITVEESWKYNKQQFYYSINLLSDGTSRFTKYTTVSKLLNKNIPERQIHRQTGISREFIRKVKNGYCPQNTHHLERPKNEVKKIIDIPKYDGWLFDLETESGTFHAGIGQGVVHNSPRRGENFVTKKITKWIAEFDSWMKYYMRTENDISFTDDYIRSNVARDMKFPKLRLGNLDAVRDWGHSFDYVRAMWLMLQQEKPDDYVICTGKSHSVRDFLDIAFSLIGIDNWSCYVVIDPKFYRPAEVDYLQGRNTKAKLKLNWEPKMNFKQLVSEMVMSDICDIKSKSPWKDSTPV